MKRLFAVVVGALAMSALVSCNKNIEPERQFWSTVTLKNNGGNFYFKESPTIALVASNLSSSPLPSVPEKRMLLLYTTDMKKVEPGVAGMDTTYSVTVAAMDTVYTKLPVKSLGSDEKDSAEYGNDFCGLYMKNGYTFPVTMIEDGYLCVSFAYNFLPGAAVIHEFNLVTGVNPNDPWEVELRHNAHGDTIGREASGYMAFPLRSLPDTGGEVRKLTLVWNSMVTGEKSKVQFDYKTRTDWPQQ